MAFNWLTIKTVLKSALTAAWTYLKSNWKAWFYIVLGILFLILLIQNRSLKTQAEKNTIIYVDSLKQYKNKVNELYVAQNTYIATEKDLRKINEELSNEVKNLKENPIVVTVVKTEYKIDSINTVTHEIDVDSLTNVSTYNWSFQDNWFDIDGTSSFNFRTNTGSTYINSMHSNAKLTLDIVEKTSTKDLQILVKTDNPYVNITGINGAVISPEKIKDVSSRIKHRNCWGVGISAGVGTGIYQQNIIFTPYIGVGITYNIITF